MGASKYVEKKVAVSYEDDPSADNLERQDKTVLSSSPSWRTESWICNSRAECHQGCEDLFVHMRRMPDKVLEFCRCCPRCNDDWIRAQPPRTHTSIQPEVHKEQGLCRVTRGHTTASRAHVLEAYLNGLSPVGLQYGAVIKVNAELEITYSNDKLEGRHTT